MTPKDISEKKFKKSKVFGYNAIDVDNFISEVFENYNKLYQEKDQLEKKIDFLVEKLSEYRQQENKLTDVLLEAKKVGDNVIKKANDKASLILSEAETKSNELLSNIKKEVEKERNILLKLQKESSEFKNKIISIYKSHIDLISTLPSQSPQLTYKTENNIDSDVEAISAQNVSDNTNNKLNNKLKERTFSISLDKNGTPIKVNEDSFSDTKNLSLSQDIKKVSGKYRNLENKNNLDNLDNKDKKFKEPLKFGSNYNLGKNKKNKK